MGRKEIDERGRRVRVLREVVMRTVAKPVWDVWVGTSDVEEEINDVSVVGRTSCVERSPTIGPPDSVDVGACCKECEDEVGLVVVGSLVEEDRAIASPFVDLVVIEG